MDAVNKELTSKVYDGIVDGLEVRAQPGSVRVRGVHAATGDLPSCI